MSLDERLKRTISGGLKARSCQKLNSLIASIRNSLLVAPNITESNLFRFAETWTDNPFPARNQRGSLGGGCFQNPVGDAIPESYDVHVP